MIKPRKYGQGLVEFALILPLLVLLFLGIAEGAHVVQSYITAQFAVREAARYAVSGQPLNSNGDPWTMPPADRVNFVKNLAVERSRGTGYTRVITDVTEYETYRDDAACDATCAGYLGVRVDWIVYDTAGNTLIKGQELGGPGPYEGEDHPGIEGGDVRVSLYHKVQIWDPIFAAIVPNGYLAVNASIVMRNEGGQPITGAPPPF